LDHLGCGQLADVQHRQLVINRSSERTYIHDETFAPSTVAWSQPMRDRVVTHLRRGLPARTASAPPASSTQAQ
jgi:hypothetical protein